MTDESIDGVPLPGRFRTLLSALRAQGFAVSSKEASARDFGNIQVIFMDGSLDVELLRDRGSPFVYLGLAGQHRLPAGVWRAFLEGSPIARLDMTFAGEARFAETLLGSLRDRLSESNVGETIAALLKSAEGVSEGLRGELWD